MENSYITSTQEGGGGGGVCQKLIKMEILPNKIITKGGGGGDPDILLRNN